MIAIIDYDAGNLKSVEKAFLALGEECVVTRDHDSILPGRQSGTAGCRFFWNGNAAAEKI